MKSTRMENKHTVVIVGSGFSGICMGYYLKQKNIEDFIILEKGNAVGGTWHENKYPGAECDIESHLYCFSFYKKHDWSRLFAQSNEIEEYILDCSLRFDIHKHIKFGHTVTKAVFDENTCLWTIETPIDSYQCNFFVPSCSPLHCPMVPKLPGFSEFQGKVMHTAQWDSSFDFRGKRVAVIGSAASGVQCIPPLVEVAKEVLVFQRTPNWIIPKFNRDFTWIEKMVFRYVPLAQYAYRLGLYHYHELFFHIFYKDSLAGRACKALALAYLRWTVRDPEVRRRLTPQYAFGCKRVLLSDNYFQCYNSPTVRLVTDRILALTADGIVTNGAGKAPPAASVSHRASVAVDSMEAGETFSGVDAVVCATGFDVFAPLRSMHISNVEGRSQGYMGVYAEDAPNLFLLLGPNSGSSHNGILLYVEAQAEHIAATVRHLRDAGQRRIVVKKEVFQRFNARLAGQLGQFVWDQCDNWYQQSGRNDTLYPANAGAFVRDARAMKLADFDIQ